MFGVIVFSVHFRKYHTICVYGFLRGQFECRKCHRHVSWPGRGPIKIGNTTLMPNLKKTSPILTCPLTPKYPRIKAGLKNIPTRLPNAALNMAAASSPPALLVNTKTMLIVIGNEAHIVIPSARDWVNAFILTINRENPNTILLTTPKLNSCTNRLNGNR